MLLNGKIGLVQSHQPVPILFNLAPQSKWHTPWFGWASGSINVTPLMQPSRSLKTSLCWSRIVAVPLVELTSLIAAVATGSNREDLGHLQCLVPLCYLNCNAASNFQFLTSVCSKSGWLSATVLAALVRLATLSLH